ncbi:MAG: hypothetical protein ACR2FM_01060 [Candidatus Saccharimonadales bacterium]
MAILVMLGWWYSRGWLSIIDVTRQRLRTIGRIFAVRVLLKTWFSPWKQIYRASTFSNFFSVAIDNTVSRFIGGAVRGTILFWAFVLGVITIIFGIISFIAWPLLPLVTIILPILTLSGVTF